MVAGAEADGVVPSQHGAEPALRLLHMRHIVCAACRAQHIWSLSFRTGVTTSTLRPTLESGCGTCMVDAEFSHHKEHHGHARPG